MEYVQSILLGIVQGVAEFLPISSSGHLVLGEELFDRVTTNSTLQLGAAESNLALNIALHLGTLGSILVVYWRQIWRTLRHPRLIAAIAVATVPAGILGILFKDQLQEIFSSPPAVGVALCVTAGLLWTSRQFEQGETPLEEVGIGQAFVIGLLQSLALVPGISRSGSTIVAGLWLGLQRDAAATFSFLIAIPVIGGAAILMTAELIQQGTTSQSQWLAYAAGAATAFVVGIVALKWLLTQISRRHLYRFAWYCLSVGLLTIGLSMLTA